MPTMSGTFMRAPTSRSGSPRVHHRHRVGAVRLAQRGAHRLGDVAVVGLLDEVRERLGVRLGARADGRAPQAVAQLLEVLDDAVVDDRDLAGAVACADGRSGRSAGRASPSGCGPARPRLTGVAVEQRRAQVGELAGALLDEHLAVAS